MSHSKKEETSDSNKKPNGVPPSQNTYESPYPHEQEPMVREDDEVTIKESELNALKREAVEYKDKYLRLLADSENARKRLQKEKQELISYAIQNIVLDFLHPLDNLENALKFSQQLSDEMKQWSLGFQMILTQFKDVLVNNGVTAIVSEGAVFDPHLHEAIETETTEAQPDGTIVAEFSKGYRMGDRTIRPARVKVAKN